MPNDPLPMPDFIAEPRRAAGGDMVRAQISATERQRTLITEYINRNRRPDADKIVGPLARREMATHNVAPPSSDLARRLTELAGTIRRIEATLLANEVSAPDVHFAAERIQDVAFALRQRGIEPMLCDALEAAIREVGDAIVRQDAAAARAAGAAAQLRELAHDVGDLIETFADRNPPGEAAVQPPTEPGESAEPGVAVPEQHTATALLLSSSVEQPLPPARATSPAGQAGHHLVAAPLPALPIPSPIDGTNGSACAMRSSPEADSALFLDSAAAFAAAATDSVATEAPPASARENLLANDLYPSAATTEHAARGEANANLFALSDEELIALFT